MLPDLMRSITGIYMVEGNKLNPASCPGFYTHAVVYVCPTHTYMTHLLYLWFTDEPKHSGDNTIQCIIIHNLLFSLGHTHRCKGDLSLWDLTLVL